MSLRGPACLTLQPSLPATNPYTFRRLLQLADEGMVGPAEVVLEEMAGAGHPPGPRALHVLVYAHIKAGSPEGALGVTRKMAQQGMVQLPETYILILLGFLHARPPNAALATEVWNSMVRAGAAPQQGWQVLCSELFHAGALAQGLRNVERGMVELRYEPLPEMYPPIVEALCAEGRVSDAYAVLERMRSRNLRVGPVHYNFIIRAQALAGCLQRAMDLLELPDFRDAPPDVASYNALLEGVVANIQPDDAASRAASAENRAFPYSPARVVQTMRLRQALSPDASTFKWIAQGFVRLKNVDKALAALDAMRDRGGLLTTLDAPYLASLLVLLAEADRPAQLSMLVSAMAEDGCSVPAGALQQDESGLTFVSRWIEGRLDKLQAQGMAAAGSSSGGGAYGSAAAAAAASAAAAAPAQAPLAALMASELREVDGVLVGMGNAVVEGDGVFMPLQHMSLQQAIVECTLRGLPTDVNKNTMLMALRDARAALPDAVMDAQAALLEERRKTAAALARTDSSNTVAGRKTLASSGRAATAGVPRDSNKGVGSDELCVVIKHHVPGQ